MEIKANVGLFLSREAHLFDQLRRFADIRKKPQIRLQDILMCVLFMPFFSLTSLLGLDRTTRKSLFKELFRSERKMVVSDSTVARVLNWLDEGQVQQFQRAFLQMFEHHRLAKRELVPGGKARRIGIIDGSCMGTHYLCMLDLCGKTDYPVMLLAYAKHVCSCSKPKPPWAPSCPNCCFWMESTSPKTSSTRLLQPRLSY